MVDVDVIVVNYRTPGDLENFLESISDESCGMNLFVCDVDPLDEDRYFVNDLADRHGATYVPFNENVGYGRSVNQAASMGKRDVLAIFNADVKLSPGAISECARALSVQPTWGALGPMQVDSSGRATHAGIFGTLDNPQWRGGWRPRAIDTYRDVRDDAITVLGSAYFVRREVWNEMHQCDIYKQAFPDAKGAFAPMSFYYEESLLSWHLHGHGYKVCYYGLVEIIHEWHGSVKKNKAEDWAARQFLISQQRFRDFCESHSIPHD